MRAETPSPYPLPQRGRGFLGCTLNRVRQKQGRESRRAATKADVNANILFVVYTTGGGGAIWNWINVDADVEAGELTLVATFITLTADNLGSSDFE